MFHLVLYIPTKFVDKKTGIQIFYFASDSPLPSAYLVSCSCMKVSHSPPSQVIRIHTRGGANLMLIIHLYGTR